MTAARDQDVAVVRLSVSVRDHVAHRALDRIEQRLATGAAMAAVVDECVKAGHVTAVKDNAPTGGLDSWDV